MEEILMPQIINSVMPLPANWQEFETVTLSALKIREKNSNFSKNGRSGQSQNGVDIYGYVKGKSIGAQCKLTFHNITKKVIDTEIQNAQNFSPALDELLICTTAPRDANIQNYVWNLNIGFLVNILFWDDITSELEKDMAIFSLHFPFVNSKSVEKEFYEDFRNIIDYILKTDPCGSPIHAGLVTDLEFTLEKWNMPDLYSKDKNFKNLQRGIISNLHTWISFMNPAYMHDIWDGKGLCFNNHPLENLEEMREAMLPIKQKIFDDFSELVEMNLF